MGYSLNPTLWSRIFPVPSEVVERHIKLCSGVSLKCLLLILHAPEECRDTHSIAARLGIASAEVSDALNYWLESGILLQDGSICTTPSESALKPASKSVQPVKSEAAPNKAIPQVNAVSESRPHFPREEAITIIEHDKTLQGLLQELQAVLGKPFTSADIDVLLALYSFYGLSAHYIMTLVHYCVTIGKSSMAYAEKVAASWIADGIDDYSVDNHIDILMQRRTNEGKIRSAFGITDRSLTQREKDYKTIWFDKFGFGVDIIQYAYEITVERTGKLAFGYLNKILHSWHEKGYQTVSDAKGESSPAKKVAHMAAAGVKSALDNRILEQFMKE